MPPRYLIGADEAGYGPNLGPLVVAATIWSVPDGVDHATLRTRLDPVLAPLNTRGATLGHWNVGDSKQLFAPGKSLAVLEQGVLTAWALTGAKPCNAAALWSAECGALAPLPEEPWHAPLDEPLPIASSDEATTALAASIRAFGTSIPIRLERLLWRSVFPREWNQLLDQHGLKSTVLSHVSLALIFAAIAALPEDAEVFVLADKHGARDRYGPLLQTHVGEAWVEIVQESAILSRYRFQDRRHVEIAWQPRGETELAVALASMVAKYVREVAMRGFNAFWRGVVPGLAPTAGYPQDAKRFFQETADIRRQLEVDDQRVWRRK